MMWALWVLPAHHLQREKTNRKLDPTDLHRVMRENMLSQQLQNKIQTQHKRFSLASIQRHLPKGMFKLH